MLIPCMICGMGGAQGDHQQAGDEEDEEPQPSTQLFEMGTTMRKHLVERHSRFVAQALLSPNPTDKIHFWLLTNVDSSGGNACEGQDVEATQAGTLGQITQQDLGNNGGDSPHEIDFGDRDDYEPNNQPDEQLLATHFLSSLEQLLSTGLVGKEEEAETHGAGNPAVVESKAIRKTFCQVCKIAICSTARQRHVYMVHMKRKDIFCCSRCDYTNNNSLWEMRKHCVSHHGGDGVPAEEMAINNEPLYADEIQTWNRRCFPEWRQKQALTQGAASKVKQEIEPISTNESTTTLNDEEILKNCVESFIQKLQSIQPQDAVPQGDDLSNGGDSMVMEAITKSEEDNSTSAGKQSDWLCHLCWEESRYPGRHIAQKHLGKPLYECPLCEEFAGSYECCTVMKHIRKVHPEACSDKHDDVNKIEPISNLERYAEEIRELQVQCFPSRPMKLARPAANSRPRERHLCRVCNAQVAQSDRQRHVYHKHLKKEKIFQCPLCSFHSNYDVHRVRWHLKWIHNQKDDGANVEPISLESKYREEIDALNEQCFPDWLHRKRPAMDTREDDEDVRIAGELEHESNDSSNHTQENTGAHFTPNKGESSRTCADQPAEKRRRQAPNTPLAVNDLTCQLCLKEFKPSSNFLRHVAKEHLNIFLYQCPLCTSYGGQDTYDVRTHMLRIHGHKESTGKEPLSNFETHHKEITKAYKECFPTRKLKCPTVMGDAPPSAANGKPGKSDEVSEAKLQLDEQKVACKECQMEMKSEDRQIHVYRHHLKEPRLYECPLCDFSHHACSSDVKNHIRTQHKDRQDAVPRQNLVEFAVGIAEWNERCFPGWINRRLPTAVLEDFSRCRLCDAEVRQLSRHIAEIHLKIPLHKCPLCEYGAAEARLVHRHMKNNHRRKEIRGLEPISNVLLHRTAFSDLHDQCFPGRPKRLSSVNGSDEGKRTKCRRCTMTISKKRRLHHLVEKHLHKAIYKCKLCSYSSQFNRQAVEAHLRDTHGAADTQTNVLSNLDKFLPELRKLSKSCFNDSEISLTIH